jgi:hypothetical protein
VLSHPESGRESTHPGKLKGVSALAPAEPTRADTHAHSTRFPSRRSAPIPSQTAPKNPRPSQGAPNAPTHQPLPTNRRVCHNLPQTRMTEPRRTPCRTLSAPLGYSYARFYAWRFS